MGDARADAGGRAEARKVPAARRRGAGLLPEVSGEEGKGARTAGCTPRLAAPLPPRRPATCPNRLAHTRLGRVLQAPRDLALSSPHQAAICDHFLLHHPSLNPDELASQLTWMLQGTNLTNHGTLGYQGQKQGSRSSLTSTLKLKSTSNDGSARVRIHA